MNEPRTKTGRRVYAELNDKAWLDDILAIEREAADGVVGRIEDWGDGMVAVIQEPDPRDPNARALAKEYHHWAEGPQTGDHPEWCAYRQSKDDDCDCGRFVQWTTNANDAASRLALTILGAKPELPSLEGHLCRFDSEHHHDAARYRQERGSRLHQGDTPMTRVWVISGDDYEDNSAYAVFTTEAGARAALAAARDAGNSDRYKIDSMLLYADGEMPPLTSSGRFLFEDGFRDD